MRTLGTPESPIRAKSRASARGVFVLALLLGLTGCESMREKWSEPVNWGAAAQGFSQAPQPQQPLIWGGALKQQVQTCSVNSIGGEYYQTRCK